MRKIAFLILIFFGMSISSVIAQNTIEVTGQVTDPDGNTLPGANITLKGGLDGQLVGTTTDIDGKYSIEVPPDGVLSVSFVGYQGQEIPVEGRSTINIEMQPTQEELEEVVVVGYGTQKKESVVGSITQTKGEDLEQAQGDLSLSSSMQGLLPGVTVSQSTGQPGERATNILIRGKSTWQNNEPLVLVDGIERDFNDINPSSIESISVLKDASATAVFGVKGANGVILITTKSGRKGRMNISYSSNLAAKQPTNVWNYLDHYKTLQLANQAYVNDNAWSNLYTQQEIENYRSGDPYLYPDVQWYDEITKDFGFRQKHNLNISGGNDFVRYFTSFGYAKNGDIYETKEQEFYDPTFGYERYNYRSNLDFSITRTTNVKLKLSGMVGIKNHTSFYQLNPWHHNRFFQEIHWTPPYKFPPRYRDGKLGGDPAAQGVVNPLVKLNNAGQTNTKEAKQFADMEFEQKLPFIAEGLKVSGKFSYNSSFPYRQSIHNGTVRRYNYSENDTIVIPSPEFVEKPATVGWEYLVSGYGYNYTRSLYYEASLDYSNTIGDHSFSGKALFFRRKGITNLNFPRYEEHWVGRITYDYKSKYLAEFNGAYTGSEKFAPGQRFGFFPSMAVGWVISNEPFIKNNLPWVNNFKVRYSYGEVGNDQGAPRWAYRTDYSRGGGVALGYPRQNYPVYAEGGAANVNATWETGVKQNLGIEGRLFGGLTFSLDLFKEYRDGILMRRQTVPVWFGQQAPTANIGETKSHGYEAKIRYSASLSRDFSYWIGGNLNFSESRVIFRDDPANRPEYQKNEGKPIGWQSKLIVEDLHDSWDDVYNSTRSIWLPNSRIPGDMNYVDYNGDGVINDQDFAPYGDLTYPAYTYGFDLGVEYKNLQLSASFYGVSKVQKNMPGFILWAFSQPTSIVAHDHSLDAWTPNNRDTDVPALHASDKQIHNNRSSSYSYVDADYLRLKRVELSYTLESEMLKESLGIQQLRLTARGQNLLTFSPLDDRLDPESNTLGAYPLVRYYNFGVEVNF
ncbi:MAG: TonB-dependent receptor [Bacteroidales bacterium]|nr:TonB-dependent receptor [Bacteroidales bacterium]